MTFILGLMVSLLIREAQAGYVFYSASFGDWTVVCWSESGAGGPVEKIPGQKSCGLSAPPPVMEDTVPNKVGRSVVNILRNSNGSYFVSLRFRGLLASNTPASLRVDDSDGIEIQPNHFGEVSMSGPDSARLITDLKQGSKLKLRSFTPANKAPRDETINLQGFDEALSTYASVLQRFGAISRR